MDNDFDYSEFSEYAPSIAPVTVKTAENELYHVTVNDSGTLIISDKESGRVFFEMMTLMLENGTAVGYNTHSDVIKHTKPSFTAFDVITRIPIPEQDPTEKAFLPHKIQTLDVFSRITLGSGDAPINITVAYEDPGLPLTVRFPTGAEYPGISPEAALDEIFSFAGSVTITDAEGLTFTVQSDENALAARVTSAADLDIIIPSIAPATDKTRFFSFNILTK